MDRREFKPVETQPTTFFDTLSKIDGVKVSWVIETGSQLI